MLASHGQIRSRTAGQPKARVALSRRARDSAGQSSPNCRLTSAYGCPATDRDMSGQQASVCLSGRLPDHREGSRPRTPKAGSRPVSP